MRLDPHYPDIALQFLADARFSLGEYELAVGAIERRLKRNPKSETAFALLASCYGWLGRFDDAHRAWDEARRMNPDFSVERRRQVQPFRNPERFREARGGIAGSRTELLKRRKKGKMRRRAARQTPARKLDRNHG